MVEELSVGVEVRPRGLVERTEVTRVGKAMAAERGLTFTAATPFTINEPTGSNGAAVLTTNATPTGTLGQLAWTTTDSTNCPNSGANGTQCGRGRSPRFARWRPPRPEHDSEKLQTFRIR